MENGKTYPAIQAMVLFYPKKEQKKNRFKKDFAIFTDDDTTVVDHCWFRGGWWDPLTMAWNAVKNGEAKNVAPVETDARVHRYMCRLHLLAGKEKIIRVMMAWYTPDSD